MGGFAPALAKTIGARKSVAGKGVSPHHIQAFRSLVENCDGLPMYAGAPGEGVLCSRS
jgi:hypothetical protein